VADEAQGSRGSGWAVASFVLGLIGFLVALTAPIPFIPILSAFTWPLGLGAMIAGWAARRQARTTGDDASMPQARWGVGLGCLGWTIQFVTSAIKVLIAIGFIALLINNALNSTPTPSP